MGKGSLMIRMIDIVFNLLFGFIVVSQIDSAVAIEPPKSTEATEGVPDGSYVMVIGVTQQGTFPVGAGELILKNKKELSQYLSQQAQQIRARDLQPGVRIRADVNAEVADALAVAKICRDLGMAKGLDVVKLEAE